jgi:hypothetical protein
MDNTLKSEGFVRRKECQMKNWLNRWVTLGMLLLLAGATTGCDDEKVAARDNGGSDGDTDSDSDVDGGSDADTDSDTDINECVSISETGENKREPADIIIILDNSGSMGFEALGVQTSLNNFSKQIVESGVDIRIVLISALSPGGDQGTCVGAPLGSGKCPADTNLPNFLHVDEMVTSNDSLTKVIDTYPEWEDMMRENTKRHFVVISDDNSDDTVGWFLSELESLDPEFEDIICHAIVCTTKNCPTLCDATGSVYYDLVSETEGVQGDLCTQEFQPLFDTLAYAVVSGSKLACEWDIPTPPGGAEVHPDLVNFDFIDSKGVSHSIGRTKTGTKDGCDTAEHAWYYDDPLNPTKIYVCPQTCAWIQDQEGAEAIIKFGCESIVV